MRILALSLSLFLAGCSTSSLEERKKEKQTVYRELEPDVKLLVDQGIISEGMSEDAVYVAWGKPAEILAIETNSGPLTKWLYKGIYYQEHSYWVFRSDNPRMDYYGRSESAVRSRRLEKSFEPHDYVSAEVDFSNGFVKSWRKRPQPR